MVRDILSKELYFLIFLYYIDSARMDFPPIGFPAASCVSNRNNIRLPATE